MIASSPGKLNFFKIFNYHKHTKYKEKKDGRGKKMEEEETIAEET